MYENKKQHVFVHLLLEISQKASITSRLYLVFQRFPGPEGLRGFVLLQARLL